VSASDDPIPAADSADELEQNTPVTAADEDRPRGSGDEAPIPAADTADELEQNMLVTVQGGGPCSEIRDRFGASGHVSSRRSSPAPIQPTVLTTMKK
jgi:hypothetical protein